MVDRTRKIAVVRGVSGAPVQALFRTLVERWRPPVRLAGVIAEDHDLPGRACSAGFLRSLSNGELFPMFQDLGPGSRACHLAGDGVLAAASAVRRAIANGCDLVLLSKFGKLEAEGGGLRDAFCAAIEGGVPVLTSVSPAFGTAWEIFAAPLFVILPADAGQIEAWWQSLRTPVAYRTVDRVANV